MGRLAIYVFYHKDHTLEEYVLYYLKQLRTVASDVLLIANGGLTEGAQKQLDALSIHYLIRENKGIDFAAWKAGLEHVGWDSVRRYDELILCNCSCYGPVYPFAEAFDRMSGSRCDFWGLNRQPDVPQKILGNGIVSFPMTEHMQSYFYVFRHAVLTSDVFSSWWQRLTAAESYWEEIRDHELTFSKYLENAGFVSDTLMDFSKYASLAPQGDAWAVCADIQLKEDRNPLVKRKLIFADTEVSLNVLEHIHYYTTYPMEYILHDYVNRRHFSLVSVIKYHIMKRITSGKRRKHYEIKEKKELFWYYLFLQKSEKRD